MRDKKDLVYRWLRLIPKGKVVTYGQISRLLGIGSPRRVGQILHQNNNSYVPCYKVVFSDGRLAENYRFGGAAAQQKRLEEEGIKVSNGRVDLVQYQWKGKGNKA